MREFGTYVPSSWGYAREKWGFNIVNYMDFGSGGSGGSAADGVKIDGYGIGKNHRQSMFWSTVRPKCKKQHFFLTAFGLLRFGPNVGHSTKNKSYVFTPKPRKHGLR